jgi:C4-dicarboxylate-specific signal transduction histidine kinase
VTGAIRKLASKGSAAHAPLDINAAIHDVLALTDGELQRHGISLHTDLAAGLPKVFGDRVQLQQVVLNLVVNAIESMITVKDRRRLLCIISQMDDCGMVSVEVRDSGSGLDSATMSRIFDAFFTTKVEGMGLGLSICRSIMDSHGGLLWTSPANSDGAAFFIAVPRAMASG